MLVRTNSIPQYPRVRAQAYRPARFARALLALLVALAFALNGFSAALAASTGLSAPTGLNIEDRTAPLDVTGSPGFGWLPQDSGGDEGQSAYEILLRKAVGGAVVWDSGKVLSSAESYVAYTGPALADGTAYMWTVRTWNKSGAVSHYAEPNAYFATGLSDSEWSGAQWIRRVTTGNDTVDDYSLYRKQFALTDSSSPIVRARAYIAASAGLWELHVNGTVVDKQYDYQAPGEGYYDAVDITSLARQASDATGSSADQLAVGVKYANWAVTNGGPRMRGPVAESTTLAAATAAGDTSITAASASKAAYYAAGEKLAIGAVGSSTFEVATIKSVSGTAIALTDALQYAHASGETVTSENGPSGLLVKIVADHADGTTDTFVSDGSWQTTKDTSELNSTVKLRSTQDAGTYIESYDARNALTGWDAVGYTPGSAWVSATSLGAHPLVNPASCSDYLSASSPCGLTHLVPMQSSLSYRTVHPTSVKTLADGTVVADFGTALYGVPVVQFNDGVAGQTITLTGSYRLDHSTLSAAASAGATSITVASLSNFALSVGDTVTVDAPADGYGVGNPEVRTVTAIDGTTLTLNRALSSDHASGVWVEGSRVGTQALDDQSTNLTFPYTQTAGAQTTDFFVGEGFRYLQISDPGETLSAAQISVEASAEDADVSTGVYTGGNQGSAKSAHQATFTSSDSTLDDVFSMMQRSALYSGQEEFNDSPDRQDGQFLGDAVDESQATMESLDERTLTREAINDFIYSQQRYWTCGTFSSSASGSLWGGVNAAYPDGDGMRDIPDYTEMFPEWLMDYYQQTGDTATVSDAYQALKNVATFLTNSIVTSGTNAGLVVALPGGGTNGGPSSCTEKLSSSYEHGILDWPADMRYDLKWLGSTSGAAEEIINVRAVEVYRALAQAATVLGDTSDATTYTDQMNTLITTINSKFVDSNGLYDDGVLSTGTTDASDTEHGQAFALAYGVAPTSSDTLLGDYISSQGMKVGPMDLGQLEQALITADRPDTLVSLLTNTADDGPAKILAENGTSMWEQWDPGCTIADCTGSSVSQTSSESFSHGWGAVGIVGILRGLLGITVTGAGASTIEIAPPDKGLASASGTEWTERGQVAVSWTRTADGVDLQVTVPDNVTATVSLPMAGTALYTASGNGAPQEVSASGGRETFTVGSGTTTFTVQ